MSEPSYKEEDSKESSSDSVFSSSCFLLDVLVFLDASDPLLCGGTLAFCVDARGDFAVGERECAEEGRFFFFFNTSSSSSPKDADEERVEDDVEGALVSKLTAVEDGASFPVDWLLSLLVAPEEPGASFSSGFPAGRELETFEGRACGRFGGGEVEERG